MIIFLNKVAELMGDAGATNYKRKVIFFHSIKYCFVITTRSKNISGPHTYAMNYQV